MDADSALRMLMGHFYFTNRTSTPPATEGVAALYIAAARLSKIERDEAENRLNTPVKVPNSHPAPLIPPQAAP